MTSFTVTVSKDLDTFIASSSKYEEDFVWNAKQKATVKCLTPDGVSEFDLEDSTFTGALKFVSVHFAWLDDVPTRHSKLVKAKTNKTNKTNKANTVAKPVKAKRTGAPTPRKSAHKVPRKKAKKK